MDLKIRYVIKTCGNYEGGVLVKFAVIGYGYWGPNIVRNLLSKNCDVKYVIDVDENRCNEVRRTYPKINTCTDFNVALNDDDVDAVVIVLPVKLHYTIAKKALLAGKHVLLEKPLAATIEESNELVAIVKKTGLVLMVDHTYIYSNAVRDIKKIIDDSDAKIIHIYSNRSNLGVFRRDVNVAWDLAPHDLSIIEYITGKTPLSLSATARCHNESGIEDTAHISLKYIDFTADITTSWISPKKIRLLEIVTDKFMIIFNDLEKEEKIELYDAGIIKKDNQIICWNNGVKKIRSEEGEPLATMLDDFISSITTGSIPVSNYLIGIDIVRILESSDRSNADNGKEVDVVI